MFSCRVFIFQEIRLNFVNKTHWWCLWYHVIAHYQTKRVIKNAFTGLFKIWCTHPKSQPKISEWARCVNNWNIIIVLLFFSWVQNMGGHDAAITQMKKLYLNHYNSVSVMDYNCKHTVTPREELKPINSVLELSNRNEIGFPRNLLDINATWKLSTSNPMICYILRSCIISCSR